MHGFSFKLIKPFYRLLRTLTFFTLFIKRLFLETKRNVDVYSWATKIATTHNTFAKILFTFSATFMKLLSRWYWYGKTHHFILRTVKAKPSPYPSFFPCLIIISPSLSLPFLFFWPTVFSSITSKSCQSPFVRFKMTLKIRIKDKNLSVIKISG